MPEEKTACWPKYSDIPDIKEDGSESIRYDDPDFPLFCRRNFIPANWILPGMTIHWHSDLEFIYVKKGSAFYQLNDCTVKMNEGEGITDDIKSSVFERFYKSDKSRSKNTGGVGLGLSIVKSILNKHGEKITVRSEPGKYAEFSFKLKKYKN